MSEKHALLCKRILLCALILGAALCALSTVLFFALSGRIESAAEKSVVADSYALFATVDLIFVGSCLAITLGAFFMKSPLLPAVPLLLPMWGILSLCWTWICAVWSDFESMDASWLVVMFGIGASLLLSLTAYVQSIQRHAILKSEEKRAQMIAEKESKRLAAKEKRDKRKRIAEKKKRLSAPKKR